MNARLQRKEQSEDLFCNKEVPRAIDGIPSLVDCGRPALAELDGGAVRCFECLERTDFRPGELSMVYAKSPLDNASMAVVHIRRAEAALSAVRRTTGAERIRHLKELHGFAYNALRFASLAEPDAAQGGGE